MSLVNTFSIHWSNNNQFKNKLLSRKQSEVALQPASFSVSAEFFVLFSSSLLLFSFCISVFLPGTWKAG